MTVASVASPPPLGLTLTARHVTYDGITLFRDLTLDLPAGHWTCLLGISGVGKSSLLRLLADLAPAGSDYHVQTSDNLPLTDRVAYMAQQDLLLPWLSVLDNITLGARLRRQPAETARAASLLEQVGLADFRHRRPDQLSGGQRQRAALARTLMEDRPVVLMDEPFSALDPVTRLQMQDLAATLLDRRTVLLVTHDPLEALRLGEQVLVLTGLPASLAPHPLPADWPAPRAVDDPRLTSQQGALLARLVHQRPAGAVS